MHSLASSNVGTASDSEARELTDYPKRVDFSRLTEQQRAKIIGVEMMKLGAIGTKLGVT